MRSHPSHHKQSGVRCTPNAALQLPRTRGCSHLSCTGLHSAPRVYRYLGVLSFCALATAFSPNWKLERTGSWFGKGAYANCNYSYCSSIPNVFGSIPAVWDGTSPFCNMLNKSVLHFTVYHCNLFDPCCDRSCWIGTPRST